MTLAAATVADRASLVNRVLVVDEDAALTDLLGIALRFEGWHVDTVRDGAAVVDRALEFAPDAILLDLVLPDITGVEVVAALRERGIRTPVIFLTGRNSLEDRLAAYAAGGDDYMTKPFGLDDVVTRLRSVFRRTGRAASSLVVGDLVLDRTTHEAWRGEEPLLLTPVEFELLRSLADSANSRVDGATLLNDARAAGRPLHPASLVSVLVGLRAKVDTDRQPMLFVENGTATLRA